MFFSHLWRPALLGQAVDEKTEVRSSQTARTLCQQLLKDTQIALDKVHINTDQSISWKKIGLKCFIFLFLDLPASGSVWGASQRAAGGCEGIAPGGEVDLRELCYSSKRLCDSRKRDVLM